MRILLKDLPKKINENEIKDFFCKKGCITDVFIPKNSAGESRRLCFIGYKTEKEATDSQVYYNNTYYKNHKITVILADDKAEKEVLRSETQLRKALFSKTIVILNIGELKEEDIKIELEKIGRILDIKLKIVFLTNNS